MDVELLSKMIGELVLDNDRVGIPGLGTFVAEVVPASFSDRGYTINPPYRRLSFHSGCSEEDVLVSYYARANNMDPATAKAVLSDYGAQVKEVLKSRKTVVFSGLGRLRATAGNTFFFVADEELDIYPEGIALQQVSLKSHAPTEDDFDLAAADLSKILSAPAADAGQTAEPVATAEAGLTEGPGATSETGQPEDSGAHFIWAKGSGALPAAPAESAEGPEPEKPGTDQAEGAGGPSPKFNGPMAPLPDPDQIAPESSGCPDDAAAELAEEVDGPSTKINGPQTSQPVPNSEKQAEPEPIKVKEETGKKGRWWIAPVVLVSIAAVALATFIILAHVAPDFIDSILYTPEELRILNY